METRYITNRKGQTFTVLIDDADAEYYDSHTWYIIKGYPTRYVNRNAYYLSRELLGSPAGQQVDHINGNPLDNRRANLRVCTVNQNRKNRLLNRDSSTGYKGVSQYKRTGKYASYISSDSVREHLGTFQYPEMAAVYRDLAALELHGEFASLNFPALRELILRS